MPDLSLVLAVLVAALFLAAVLALLLRDRAVAPAAALRRSSGGDALSLRGAFRSASRRGVFATVIAIVVLVVTTVIGNGLVRDLIGNTVFATPLIAGIAGVGAYALLQGRRLPSRPAGEASLTARRASGFAQTRSFVTMGLAVALLLVLEIFALVVTPTTAAFTGIGAGALLFLVGALVVAEVSALRQIAVRAALPTNLAAVDLAIRQIATRFVLLLSTSAVLATAALIALDSGGWLINNAAILNPGQPLGTLAGAVVAVVGSLAAIGSLASVTAAVTATVKHARSSSRRAALPVAVSA